MVDCNPLLHGLPVLGSINPVQERSLKTFSLVGQCTSFFKASSSRPPGDKIGKVALQYPRSQFFGRSKRERGTEIQ
jgi:hypothetical protein